MLYRITDLTDPLLELVRDDPVRPELDHEFRVNEHSEIFVLVSDDEYRKPQAVVCVRYKDSVPKSVLELAMPSLDLRDTAVFYTIWSYVPGAGRKLIVQARNWLIANRTEIKTFVTLSPPTDMARVFHLRNGAGVLSVNEDTVNYIYQ